MPNSISADPTADNTDVWAFTAPDAPGSVTVVSNWIPLADPAGGPNRSVLLLGYAGWGEGQLEDELGENVWLTAEADPELIFDADYDGKWAKALAGLGVDPAQLSGQSGRA